MGPLESSAPSIPRRLELSAASPFPAVPGVTLTHEVYRGRTRVLYRGLRDSDGTRVIVKTLLDAFATGRTLAALRHEFEVLREIAAAGVPRALELVDAGAGLALIMEDVPGEPLKALIEDGRLTFAAAVTATARLAAVIGEVHRHGIIHKDVNPNNVLVELDTGRVTLVDFGSASRLPFEQHQVGHPSVVEGTIAYMSPEQTGRMNRDIDYRTDFYSLGVTLYEMITGSLPFESQDPLEVVHGHIAKAPQPPTALDRRIPTAVSEIVMRLLSKNAEDRYQSALGIQTDLERCLDEWERTGDVTTVVLGLADLADRFVIPQRLYGRDEEVETLLAAFERVSQGGAELMLVSGYAGIGKTSLIHEIHRTLTGRRGYFISGKFDQPVGNLPYGALAQAFQGLVRQLLTEREADVEAWRRALLEALGTSGQVIVDVIPDVERLVGPQPAVPPLGGVEAQNRFTLLFRAFLGVLASARRPLVIFLDDLQWADSATLRLLETFLVDHDIDGLLVIGAYRANEVDAVHPLTRTVAAIRAGGARLEEIVLGPLHVGHLTRFVADTLHCGGPRARPLAELVLQKTDGNPFFVTQFLRTLHQQELLRFDYDRHEWQFDLPRIRATDITDNVVDLMAAKIRRLSPPAQEALKLAACIGSRFDVSTLATVRARSTAETAADVWEAVQEGLVIPLEDIAGLGPEGLEGEEGDAAPACKFLHDRVQQAAYALIPEATRGEVHLTVGRLLLSHSDATTLDERLFEVVDQLNYGMELLTDRVEQVRLAELNVRAGNKARDSAAYQAALSYFRAAARLLHDTDWVERHAFAFSLHLAIAECEYLGGLFDEAEVSLASLLSQGRSPMELAEVRCLQIVLFENRSRYADAVASGRQGLALFDVSLPDTEQEQALEAEMQLIQSAIQERGIGELVNLPVMTDATLRMVMRILAALWAPSYLAGDQPLTRLLSATMVRLSLHHGNAEESAYGYVTHAITVGPVRGDYHAAFEWGELALAINRRFDDGKRAAKIHQQFNAHVNPWRRPLETCIPHAREACRRGLEAGDLTYAGYGAFTESWPALLTARSLGAFVREYSATPALLERIKMGDLAAAQRIILAWALALQGRTSSRGSLTTDDVDEQTYAKVYAANPFFMTFLHVAKLHVAYMLEEYEEAVRAAQRARLSVYGLGGTIWPVVVEFWTGLVLTALGPESAERYGHSIWTELSAARGLLHDLAESCPENFRCSYLLLAGEMERLAGHPADAAAHYEAAMTYAQQLRRPDLEALAAELYGKFWLARAQHRAADVFLTAAHSAYEEWGAAAKASDLMARHPALLRRTAAARPSAGVSTITTTESRATMLDFTSVMKAAEALAREIELPKLLAKLVTILMENAGGRRVCLALDTGGEWVIQAAGDVGSEEVSVLQSTPMSPDILPETVVSFVRRTSECLVLADATADEAFARDPYIATRRPKSILCAPVLNQGRLIGMVYLENDLAADAFSSDRLEVVQMLSSHAAVAMTNAQLFAEVTRLRDRFEAENVYLQEEIKSQRGFEEIIGKSQTLRRVLQRVERVAPTETTVLIVGETGTGKEVIARAIHERSNRKDRPLIAINCGAISSGLVESELFGHEKGAFTGAVSRKIGRFELADGGTIFLDEVGDLPPDLQVKLLRVLQEGEFERVGGTKTLRVSVRVIAATHQALEELVAAGRFRSDLYFRLNVFPIETPPLRDRPEDIPLLVRHFVLTYAGKMGKRINAIPKSEMDSLVAYAWPGNVRELRNVIERSVILSSGDRLELGEWITGQRGPADEPPGGTLADAERDHIVRALTRTGWRVSGPKGAAAVLGLKPTTLEARMRKLGIRRPGA